MLLELTSCVFGTEISRNYHDTSSPIRFSPEDGSNNFLRNVGFQLHDNMASQPGRSQFDSHINSSSAGYVCNAEVVHRFR